MSTSLGQPAGCGCTGSAQKASPGLAVLAGLFGAEARALVLTWLCQHPDEPVHVRELARRCGLTPNQVFQQLRRLEGIGLVRSRRVGRSRVYEVDEGCPIFNELRSIVLKTTGLAGRLAEGLRDLPVDVAFIFGSVAAAEGTQRSGVDLLVVGDVSGRELAAVTQPMQAELERAFNAVRYTASEFRAQVRAGDAFVSQVLDGPKVSVKGGTDDLRRLAEGRADPPARPASGETEGSGPGLS